MEGRSLSIRRISATGLKDVYAVVSVSPYNASQHIAVDDEAGSTNPFGDQTLSFFVPEHLFQQPNSCVTVEIFSNADGKLIGTAVVSLSKLDVQEMNQCHATLSYVQVKLRSGKVKGLLRLVTHVGKKTTSSFTDLGSTSMHAEVGLYDYPQTKPVAPYGYPPEQYLQQRYGGIGGQGYYSQAGVPPHYYNAAPPQYYNAAQPQRRQGTWKRVSGFLAVLADVARGLTVYNAAHDVLEGGGGP